ncbi:hypothetical protein PIB30_075642 [Stylosanthes scabra]|uniref:Uncharacterized protein n=1 Tax=Stylosanthes scabra TaxID=79078 RepID=A0ABU6WTG2_9FABA|nr:hypothetical protein [Stylosanthes scabra]
MKGEDEQSGPPATTEARPGTVFGEEGGTEHGDKGAWRCKARHTQRRRRISYLTATATALGGGNGVRDGWGRWRRQSLFETDEVRSWRRSAVARTTVWWNASRSLGRRQVERIGDLRL